MKLSRIIILVVIVAIGIQSYLFFTQKKAPDPTSTQVGVATQEPGEDAIKPEGSTSTTKVTVASVSKQNVAYLDLVGTVKANKQSKIYPTAAGEIEDIYVQEGDTVKAGDTLLTIAGIGGGKNAAEIQLKIAEANYAAARDGLQNTVTSNDSSLRSAELLLESAKNQAEGSYIDVEVLRETLAGAQDGIKLLEDTLETNRHKNELDLEKTRDAIDDLDNALDDLKQQRDDTVGLLQDKIASANDNTERDALEQELAQAEEDFDKSIEALKDQLASAKTGYKTLQDALTLGENQILGQLLQSDTQTNVLALNQVGLETKLGLDGNSSDPLRLAQEAFNATAIRNNAALIGARLQADMAKFSLDLAHIQADGLTIKAPFDGIVGAVYVRSGDQISPQVPLVQVTGTQNFELKVAVSPESATRIKTDGMAQVAMGNAYMQVPIKGISPVTDPSSHLVNVTVGLPKVLFRADQTRKVKLPLKVNTTTAQSFFVPLDAVIIGTEEQYVFIIEDGKAKRIPVTLGIVYGDQVQITKGLREKDQIIVEGAKNIINEQEVHL